MVIWKRRLVLQYKHFIIIENNKREISDLLLYLCNKTKDILQILESHIWMVVNSWVSFSAKQLLLLHEFLNQVLNQHYLDLYLITSSKI